MSSSKTELDPWSSPKYSGKYRILIYGLVEEGLELICTLARLCKKLGQVRCEIVDTKCEYTRGNNRDENYTTKDTAPKNTNANRQAKANIRHLVVVFLFGGVFASVFFIIKCLLECLGKENRRDATNVIHSLNAKEDYMAVKQKRTRQNTDTLSRDNEKQMCPLNNGAVVFAVYCVVNSNRRTWKKMETMTHVTSETVNIKMQNAFGSGSYKPLTKFLAVESVPMIFNVEAECRLLLTDFMASLKTKSKSFLKTVANNLNNVTFMTSLVVFPVIRGLDELFSKVARNENPTTDEMMSFELMRLSSFHNCPGLSDQSWLRLAQAGFYYPGQGDQLTCFCCGLRRGGWQSGENPMRIHRELSPHCPFVNSQESVNIPVGQIPESGYEHSSPRTDGLASILPGVPHSGSVIHHAAVDTNHGQPDSENNEADAVSRRDQNSSSRSVSTRYTEQIATNSTGHREFNNNAQFSSQRNSQNGDLGLPNADGSGTHRQFGHVKYLRYATVPVRVSSYMNWPRYMSQTPQELAVAGFYSAGFGDSVRCFCCGIGLRNWQTGDSPWVEHARYSPTCVYVRMSKGEDFIEMVQAAVRELDEGRSSHTRQGHAATRGNSARTDSVSVSDLGIKAYTGGPEDPFESEAVQSVIEMGYSPHTIQMALGSLVKKSGWSGLDAMSLMEVILEQEDKVQNHTEARGAEGGSDVTSQSTDIISEDALKEQNRELREKKLCKICFTEALSIVFLPCGHLCCCVQCAQPMKKCPICREVIKGSVRSFLE